MSQEGQYTMVDREHHITPEEINGAPRRTGRNWFDLAAASGAIFISVVSLVIGIRGEAIQRELLAANSWPFLELEEERSSASADSIAIRNEGVGSAKVISFEVFYAGKPLGDAADLLRACCGSPTDAHVAQARISRGIALGDVAGNVIRPDQSRVMISLRKPTVYAELFDAFDQNLGSFKFRICYCSILDRCWLSDLRTLTPKEVLRCPIPARAFTMISLAPVLDGKGEVMDEKYA